MKSKMAVRFAMYAAVVLSFTVWRVLPAHSCAALDEEYGRVRVMDESAVIVWDAKQQTQHFIRRATFDAKGRSVGFIVPTPTVPQLAEADNLVFGELEELIKPKVIYKEYPVYALRSWIGTNAKSDTFNKAGSELEEAAPEDTTSVEVVSTQRVGDYDATILRATNAGALNRWLKKNGYNSNAAFEKWLQVYVEKGWIVTAFKVVKGNEQQTTFSSELVRMSFKTPRPFFPYREPQENQTEANVNAKQRSLRIFFFASHRMQAASGIFDTSQIWPGQIKWADDMRNHGYKENNNWQGIAQSLKLPQSTLQQARWMTVFEDKSTPRPGTDDVFFASAPNQSTLPAPILVDRPIKKPIYIELVVLALVAVGGAFVVIMRRH